MARREKQPMIKKSLGARLQGLWDSLSPFDYAGEVWRVSDKEQIQKRYRGKIYHLFAYSRWKRPAEQAAKKATKEGLYVLIAPVEDKRVHKGEYLSYGIWVRPV